MIQTKISSIPNFDLYSIKDINTSNRGIINRMFIKEFSLILNNIGQIFGVNAKEWGNKQISLLLETINDSHLLSFIQSKEHGLKHTIETLELATQMAEYEVGFGKKLDPKMFFIPLLWHDITEAYIGRIDHHGVALELMQKTMIGIGVPMEVIFKLSYIFNIKTRSAINKHAFVSHVYQDYPEAGLIKDGDAITAANIGRTLQINKHYGNPFFDSRITMSDRIKRITSGDRENKDIKSDTLVFLMFHIIAYLNVNNNHTDGVISDGAKLLIQNSKRFNINEFLRQINGIILNDESLVDENNCVISEEARADLLILVRSIVDYFNEAKIISEDIKLSTETKDTFDLETFMNVLLATNNILTFKSETKKLHNSFVLQALKSFVTKDYSNLYESTNKKNSYKEFLIEIFPIVRIFDELTEREVKILGLAVLLHDIYYLISDKDNSQHGTLGADFLAENQYYLKTIDPSLSNSDINDVIGLIRHHGYTADLGRNIMLEDFQKLPNYLNNMLLILDFCDAAGKVKNGQALNCANTNFVAHLDNLSKSKGEFIKPELFYEIRLRSLFSPTPFFRLREKEYKQVISQLAFHKYGEELISFFNTRLKVNVFPLFKDGYNYLPTIKSGLTDFSPFLNLLAEINQKTATLNQKYIVLDAPDGFMNLPQEDKENRIKVFLEKVIQNELNIYSVDTATGVVTVKI